MTNRESKAIEAAEKAVWYINRQIERLEMS